MFQTNWHRDARSISMPRPGVSEWVFIHERRDVLDVNRPQSGQK